MIITIFIDICIFLKLNLLLIYMIYFHVIVFFIFVLCRNLSKTTDVLDPISFGNIDLLNEWISE
jgi:hypothetical protein